MLDASSFGALGLATNLFLIYCATFAAKVKFSRADLVSPLHL